MVKQYPDWTLIGENHGIIANTSMMFCFLDKHKITLKKTFRNAKVISEEVQEERLRLKYYEEVEKIAEENLIFIDETGVWEGMERSRSRAERGKIAFSRRPRNHGQKHTVYWSNTAYS